MPGAKRPVPRSGGAWSMEHGARSMEYGAWSKEHGARREAINLQAIAYCLLPKPALQPGSLQPGFFTKNANRAFS